jgi:hypothetical protein
LIRQLQVLLLNFGVFATTRHTDEHAWNLTVSGQALEKLARFVKFDEVWKNERIRIYGENRAHRLHNYGALLPAAITETLRSMQDASEHSLRSLYGAQTAEYQRARVNLLQGHRLDRTGARQVYEHFSEVRTPFAEAFFAEDNEQKLYVQVTGLEAGFAEVFDISVPGSHSFIAGGLGNHNTINFPEAATEADVATAYMLSWELGAKGITVYVTGSRDKVVLETHATAGKKQGEQAAAEAPAAAAAAVLPVSAGEKVIWHETKRPRPRSLVGETFTIETPLGKAFVTVNTNGGDQPFEVFINTAKAGSETAAVSEAIGRLISYVLRLASPIAPIDRLREVVTQLTGIGGGRSLGFGANRVRSLPDGVGQVLGEYLTNREGQPVHMDAESGGSSPYASLDTGGALPAGSASGMKIGDLCPECGEAAVVNEEGCRKCYACGFSEC